jgi:hypothetical protein
VCTGLGWIDQAFEYLSRACKEKSGWMTYIKIDLGSTHYARTRDSTISCVAYD